MSLLSTATIFAKAARWRIARPKTLSSKEQKDLLSLPQALSAPILLDLDDIDPQVMTHLADSLSDEKLAIKAMGHPSQSVLGALALTKNWPDVPDPASEISWTVINSDVALFLINNRPLESFSAMGPEAFCRFENSLVDKLLSSSKFSLVHPKLLSLWWPYMTEASHQKIVTTVPRLPIEYQIDIWAIIRASHKNLVTQFIASTDLFPTRLTPEDRMQFPGARDWLAQLCVESKESCDHSTWLIFALEIADRSPSELANRFFHIKPPSLNNASLPECYAMLYAKWPLIILEKLLQNITPIATKDPTTAWVAGQLGHHSHDWIKALGQQDKELDLINSTASHITARYWNLAPDLSLECKWSLWQKSARPDRSPMDLSESEERLKLWDSLWSEDNPGYWARAGEEIAAGDPKVFLDYIKTKMTDPMRSRISTPSWSMLLTAPDRDFRLKAIQTATQYKKTPVPPSANKPATPVSTITPTWPDVLTLREEEESRRRREEERRRRRRRRNR